MPAGGAAPQKSRHGQRYILGKHDFFIFDLHDICSSSYHYHFRASDGELAQPTAAASVDPVPMEVETPLGSEEGTSGRSSSDHRTF